VLPAEEKEQIVELDHSPVFQVWRVRIGMTSHLSHLAVVAVNFAAFDRPTVSGVSSEQQAHMAPDSDGRDL